MNDDTLPQYSHNPQILQVYLYFRLALAAILFAMFAAQANPHTLGVFSPTLYQWTALSYIAICAISVFVLKASELVHSFHRITLLLIVDLVAIFLLIHASGGLESGLGYLLLINTAIVSIFIRGQMSLAFAALTSIFAIGETIYMTRYSMLMSKTLFSAGLLGILIFATSITFHYLTKKVRLSDREAALQASYAKHLENLAQHIITRMRTGVIVIDGHNDIELINESAIQLLDLPQSTEFSYEHLSQLASLSELVEQWKENPVIGHFRYYQVNEGQNIRVNFAQLDKNGSIGTILYLEDYRAITQHAQQLKLASLGRLAASIAHEVRNPLGAISHAAQLMSESQTIAKGDKRLTEIILDNSGRVNQIIENTLAISSRKEPKPALLELRSWLGKFIVEYKTVNNCQIEFSSEAETIMAKIDPVHLSQVLSNLIDNGIRYSKIATGIAKVVIRVGISNNGDTPFIEVIDDGKGIAADKINQIYDPFYTSDEKGSGLGLYISKELCEINQATLHYNKTKADKSCFRIGLSHYQRMT